MTPNHKQTEHELIKRIFDQKDDCFIIMSCSWRCCCWEGSSCWPSSSWLSPSSWPGQPSSPPPSWQSPLSGSSHWWWTPNHSSQERSLDGFGSLHSCTSAWLASPSAGRGEQLEGCGVKTLKSFFSMWHISWDCVKIFLRRPQSWTAGKSPTPPYPSYPALSFSFPIGLRAALLSPLMEPSAMKALMEKGGLDAFLNPEV